MTSLAGLKRSSAAAKLTGRLGKRLLWRASGEVLALGYACPL